MRYTHLNARGATVHDIEGRRRIDHVMSVDTETGEVECAYWPIRLKPDPKPWHAPMVESHLDEVDTFVMRFHGIAPIFGGADSPQAFHCYGPQ